MRCPDAAELSDFWCAEIGRLCHLEWGRASGIGHRHRHRALVGATSSRHTDDGQKMIRTFHGHGPDSFDSARPAWLRACAWSTVEPR